MSEFPHPSRPGHYRLSLDDDLRRALAMLSDAMIPGDDRYPSGSEAQVPLFVEARASAADLEALRTIVGDRQFDGSSAAQALRQLENGNPLLFAWFREFVYFGYYASHRVLAAMADAGYAYHGAPQPLGYQIDEQMMLPGQSRGSFIPTAEVARAAL